MVNAFIHQTRARLGTRSSKPRDTPDFYPPYSIRCQSHTFGVMDGAEKDSELSTMRTVRTEQRQADEAFFASLGYKQEFKREFTPFEVFGIDFSIIGFLPSIASVLAFSLPND